MLSFSKYQSLSLLISPNFNVKCKEQVIKSQESVRYLELYIDIKYMDCEKIVNSIIGKVNTKLEFFFIEMLKI